MRTREEIAMALEKLNGSTVLAIRYADRFLVAESARAPLLHVASHQWWWLMGGRDGWGANFQDFRQKTITSSEGEAKIPLPSDEDAYSRRFSSKLA